MSLVFNVYIHKLKFRISLFIISVTIGGTLNMKILKRTAHFDSLENASAPLSSQNIKLNIPKKTKLFVDQTLRERENCTLMHRVFQHDLYQLRLNTARSVGGPQHDKVITLPVQVVCCRYPDQVHPSFLRP